MTLPNPGLVSLSSWLLFGTFVGYLTSTMLYVAGFIGQRISRGAKFARNAEWASRAHLLGVILHAGAILARWQGAGHWPTSNMYEFLGFMAFTSMLAFQIFNRMYRLPTLGALVAPIGLFLIAYSYVFPPKVQPLVPALKSIWLPLHVSMVALGYGFFAVATGAALLYLFRVRNLEMQAERQKEELAATASAEVGAAAAASVKKAVNWNVRGMELVFYIIFVMVGFVLLANTLRHLGFQWIFDEATYHLPPIIGPAGEAVGSKGHILGVIPMPLIEMPPVIKGKHMNTLLYSLAAGWLLYAGARRLMTGGRPIGDAIAARVGGNPELFDEISYRAVAIGYPTFTLGGLVFAMLWAKEAWSRYWSWDPKETWAFITWCVYSVYLHLRITKGYEGRRSAWLAVLGFGVLLFTLVGVNLLIVGLHSYAGGD